MSFFVTIAAALAFAAQADNEPPIKVLGYPWAPFISPMGEPFRVRVPGEVPMARWFGQADQDRDGMLTAVEMQADAERFFHTLDSSRDGEIDPEELAVYESEVAPEVQVNSRWKRSPQAVAEANSGKERGRDERWRADRNVDGYQVYGLQGAARYGLLNIPEPVAGADSDFDRGTTLDEFQRAAIHRFQLLDSKRAGRLTLAELALRLPSRPTKGGRIEGRKEAVDTRIGQPFPVGD